MCACCTQYEKIMRIWGLEEYTVNIKGQQSRTITLSSTYKGTAMPSVDYHIYGGKSGTWTFNSTIGKVMNLTLVVKSKIDDTWLVGCIMKSTVSDRGIPFEQLIDWLENYRNNPSTQEPSISAEAAAAAIIPLHNPMSYSDVNYCLIEKNGDTQYPPASITKLMTAMVTLDYCNLDEILKIEQTDIQSGSGPLFYEGDEITVKEALITLFLQSSNTIGVALSRYVGNKIINIKNK